MSCANSPTRVRHGVDRRACAVRKGGAPTRGRWSSAARLRRVSNEIEIGRGKRGRRAYSFDDVAIVPSRRTRDPQNVSLRWQIDAFEFSIPVIAAPMDSVMSPATAIALGRHGGLGVLDLEGVWTRYEDPTAQLEEIASLDGPDATRACSRSTRSPSSPSSSPLACRRSARRA